MLSPKYIAPKFMVLYVNNVVINFREQNIRIIAK